MVEKLAFDGIEEPLLENPTHANLTKTCLKYSDALIVEDEEGSKEAVETAKIVNCHALIILRLPTGMFAACMRICTVKY